MSIEQITITDCTDTSFLLSLTARIYDTGPLPATIANMSLSMYSTSDPDSKAFATIALPPIHAHPAGTVCQVVEQRVQILDFAAFHTFNRNLLLQEELAAYVRGTGTLCLPWPVGFVRTEVKYEKVEMLKGLDGVHTSVLETRKASRSLLKGKPTAIEVDACIVSKSSVSFFWGGGIFLFINTCFLRLWLFPFGALQSLLPFQPWSFEFYISLFVHHVRLLHTLTGYNRPVSVDMGAVQVEIVFSGVRIATVQADALSLKKGDNHVTLKGTMDFVSIGKNLGAGLKFLKKDVLDDEVETFVKGLEGKQCVWLDQTVKLINSKIVMGSTMADLVRSIYTEEEAGK